MPRQQGSDALGSWSICEWIFTGLVERGGLGLSQQWSKLGGGDPCSLRILSKLCPPAPAGDACPTPPAACPDCHRPPVPFDPSGGGAWPVATSVLQNQEGRSDRRPRRSPAQRLRGGRFLRTGYRGRAGPAAAKGCGPLTTSCGRPAGSEATAAEPPGRPAPAAAAHTTGAQSSVMGIGSPLRRGRTTREGSRVWVEVAGPRRPAQPTVPTPRRCCPEAAGPLGGFLLFAESTLVGASPRRSTENH